MPNSSVCVVNLGCRVNRVESDRITQDLARRGFPLVGQEDASVIVINTCAVTGEAEAKTRKAVRHALNMPRSPLVLVTGCVVNLHAESLTALSDRVVAEPDKSQVAARVHELLGVTGQSVAHGGEGHAASLGELLGRSRLGVKIQDGCNHRCTYCIVWKARGPERSVAVHDVLGQVREACDAGIPEVVLTGVNLGAYRGLDGCGAQVGIAGLLDTILRETDIPQVRLSSIEPMDVSLALIETMAAHADRVAPFLHLPVQSGCTATLRRMGRPYSAERFLAQVEHIRKILPAIALSCDVIAGFPGETDREFEDTLRFCDKVAFSRMHVFRYSKRPGTPAATAPDQVDPRIMAARASRLRDLGDALATADAAARVGTVENAVVEFPGQGTLGSFHRVALDAAVDGVATGSLVKVNLTGISDSGTLIGSIVEGE